MFVESLRILVRAEERMGKALHRSADKSRHLYFKKGGGGKEDGGEGLHRSATEASISLVGFREKRRRRLVGRRSIQRQTVREA